MKVLLLGGTGTIGQAVVQQLSEANAKISVLCRSPESCHKAESLSTIPILGDIERPIDWIAKANKFDGIIHLACGFGENMGDVDTALMSALIEATQTKNRILKFLYTGGVWCFGNTSGVANETSPKNPISEFAWMVTNSKTLLNTPHLHSVIVYPAVVVSEENDYVPAILKTEYQNTGALTVPESRSSYWSLVDVNNIAELYLLALDKAQCKTEYLGCGEPGVRVELLARKLVADDVNVLIHEKPIAYWTEKYWTTTKGYGLDQRFSSQYAQDTLGWKSRKLFH